MAGMIAATSVGIVKGTVLADLDYQEDSGADVDMNVVCLSDGRLVEVQGTAEKAAFSRDQFLEMLDVASAGCIEIDRMQREALQLDRR